MRKTSECVVFVELKTRMTEEGFREGLHKKLIETVPALKELAGVGRKVKMTRRLRRKMKRAAAKFVNENFFYEVRSNDKKTASAEAQRTEGDDQEASNSTRQDHAT